METKSTTSTYNVRMNFVVEPFEQALIEYYMKKFDFKYGDVFRLILKSYVLNDSNFSINAFKRFFTQEYLPELDDPERQNLAKQLFAAFREERSETS